jgi:hypothetical protein
VQTEGLRMNRKQGRSKWRRIVGLVISSLMIVGGWCLNHFAWRTGAGGIGQGVVFLVGTSLILVGLVRFVEDRFNG